MKYKKQPHQKELNSFEKHLSDKNEKMIKKQKASQQIVDPQIKKKTANKFKVKDRDEDENVNKKAKNLFELDSEEEQEQQDLKNWRLTHNGRELQQNNDYNEQIDDYSSEDQAANKMMQQYNFAGFDEGKEKNKKTKAEVYKDIIKNSKIRKLDKVRQKEENSAKILELNNAFPLILDQLQVRNKAEEQKQKNLSKQDEYYTLSQLFKNDEKVIPVAIVNVEKTNKDQQKDEKFKRRRREQIEALQQSESDGDEINDDQMPGKNIKSEREKKMLKGFKKVQQLSEMMEQIRKVRKVKEDDLEDELDELESEESNEDEDDMDDEESGEQNDEESGEQNDEDEDDENEAESGEQNDEDEEQDDENDEDEEQDDEKEADNSDGSNNVDE